MLGVLVLGALAQAAQPATPVDAGRAALAGAWTVDLRARPTDAPYTQPMVLTLADDGTVTGSFYNSAIEAGRWRSARGRTCVSFRTTDGRGPYHTAACLTGATVTGQTWAEHRNFLFNWDATRQ